METNRNVEKKDSKTLRTEEIESALNELGRSGCYGNSDDYLAWVRAKGVSGVNTEEFNSIFQKLLNSGIIKKLDRATTAYKFNFSLDFPKQIEYAFSCSYEHFPIQLARSRLESFLYHHKVDEDTISLILIGATEGFENAVKYNSGNDFTVRYWLDDNVFNMIIENDMNYVSVEENIARGKFDFTTTLMRGILVMNKIFDFMDLNFIHNNKHAVLVVKKHL